MSAVGPSPNANDRASAAWSADGIRRCAPQTLGVIAALLLEPCDLANLLTAAGSPADDTNASAALVRIVAGVRRDGFLAKRLARRLTLRAAPVGHLFERSPFEILTLWGARSGALSRREIGVMLGRLACTGDAVLEPLARRLCRDVQHTALRGLPRDAPVPGATAPAGTVAARAHRETGVARK